MSPSIRIDEDVYKYLKRNAEAFVDTPNSVLRRILGLDEATDGAAASNGRSRRVVAARGVGTATRGRATSVRRTRKRRSRAPAGSLLPEDEYVPVLLVALRDRGGSGPAGEIADVVGRELADRLTATDKEQLPSGGIRWRNRLQFVRLRLVEEGILAKDSPRGVWALSTEGSARADELIATSA